MVLNGEVVTMESETAAEISADVVAKLTDAIENLDSMSSDQVLVVLNEALTTISELVQLLDDTYQL
jgi:hypothetical protein